QYGRAGVVPAQTANQGQAVHPRQHPVQNERLVYALERHRERGFTVGGEIHDMAALGETAHQIPGGAAIVFDYQHAQTGESFLNSISSCGDIHYARRMAEQYDRWDRPWGEGASLMTRVLVVEDDLKTAAEISAALGDHGFDVDCAHTGREGLLKAASERYEAIILDRMLPGGIDGLAVLSTLRSVGVEAPVLILSALSAVDERVRGLRAGGDDYLTKPFEFLELTARIEVLVRRQAIPQRNTMLHVGDLEIDLLTHQVRRAVRTVDLLPREYRLLEYLMRHEGQVVTRTM